MESQLPLLRGTLDMLVLKTLSVRPMYGYAISKTIKGVTDEVFSVEEGSLYPALHRMEKRKWIRGKWVRSETGHRAREYDLTAKGRTQLERELDRWARFRMATMKVLELEAQGAG